MAGNAPLMKIKRPKRGRPAKAAIEGQRNALGLRVTADLKRKLEESAAAFGRSQSQEAEFRLEQSFRDEGARDREWGGKKLHGLFRMMIGALQIIEESRANSCNADWATFLAVNQAWEVLLFANLAPTKDQSFGDYLESIGGPPTDFKMPPRPTPPKHPMAGRTLPDQTPSPKEITAFERERKAYEKECRRWIKEADEYQSKMNVARSHLDDMENLGTKTVFDMFPVETRD
jgi:hypothetical protein